MRQTLVFFLAVLVIQCSNKEKTLYKNKGQTDPVKYIIYSGSEKHGYFMSAEMFDNGENYYYNISFLTNGKVIYVLKYESRFIGLDGYDSKKQFLVTDTLSEFGPNYFGESINGYYDSYIVNNFLNQPHPPKQMSKISDNESLLFKMIDSLAKAKKINFNRLDSIGVLGWFKYNFISIP